MNHEDDFLQIRKELADMRTCWPLAAFAGKNEERAHRNQAQGSQNTITNGEDSRCLKPKTINPKILTTIIIRSYLEAAKITFLGFCSFWQLSLRLPMSDRHRWPEAVLDRETIPNLGLDP